MCEGQKVLLAITTELKLTNVQRHNVEIYYTKFNRYRSRNVRSRIQFMYAHKYSATVTKLALVRQFYKRNTFT
jgi:hypothetical protein